MTCKEALAAHYKVTGKLPSGVSQHAPYLSFHEAQRFYNHLIEKGYEVKVTPIVPVRL